MADTAITLPCSNMPLKEKMAINWQWLPHGADSTRLILSADRRQEFLGRLSKRDARLADSGFWKSGNFSLSFRASSEDGGHYTCLINQAQKTLKEHVMLLVVLTVSADPPLPVPEQSTLRLQAKVSGSSSVLDISWLSPHGLPLHYEVLPEGGVITKLPKITLADKGDYICKVRPQGNRGRPASLFLYPVTVDGKWGK
ncbi:basement membrane-specific heparan sulfate proteoglycan core protein-like isoform X2 [Brienomyrus brachyistius]|nr:basement membrane-specific heparan sulfate proteoglycan core protein-like isoform X2 [Brienomyrus brachyistius]